MTLLIILTLVFAAVLVAALAVSLISIWISLRHINVALKDVGDALAEARDAAAPLQSHLERFEKPCAAASEAITQPADGLEQAAKHLSQRQQPVESA